MDAVVAVRKLVAELVKGEQIEVRRSEIVARDLVQLSETLGRPPSPEELEVWLGDHAQVTELYASRSLLEELIHRHLIPPPPPPPENLADARHPELERQLIGADSSQPFLVYADWLQEQGDPLGELVALGIRATEGGEEDAARFERVRKRFVPSCLDGINPARFTLCWRYGFVLEIAERDVQARFEPAVWEQLLRARVCELVHTIRLTHVTPEVDAAIAEHAGPALRTLIVDHVHGPLPSALMRRELHCLAIYGGSVTISSDVLPGSLEQLEVRAHVELVLPLQLGVRSLHLVLNDKLFDVLSQAQLPALTHLGISGGTLTPTLFETLAALPIAAQLTSLALTSLELTDQAMHAMARVRGFTQLTELDVSFNELTRDGLASAKQLAANVVSSRQHKPGTASEQRVRWFAASRYQAAEEILDPDAWRRSGVDGDIRWARYQGTTDDYELFVSADLARYGCSCPSSIQPCKHVAALALLAERTTLPTAPSQGIEDRVSPTGE